jgi:hypothetical protein
LGAWPASNYIASFIDIIVKYTPFTDTHSLKHSTTYSKSSSLEAERVAVVAAAVR